MIKIFLFSILFFTSCAGSIKITHKDCQTNATFDNRNEPFTANHQWKVHIWSHRSSYEKATIINLKESLSKQGLACEKVKKIKYSIGQSLLDQLLSLIPFTQRSTVEFYVETI